MVKPEVTDHAVVRWIERVMGVDVDAIKAEILTPDRIIAIQNGCTSIKVGRATLKIVDGVVVTVLD